MFALVSIGIVFGGGWWAANSFESPAQRAARARPPVAGPIYATVTQGALDDEVSGSGPVTYETTFVIPSTSLPAGAVVTRHPVSARRTVKSGDNLIEVNSRPLFVLQGAFPFFRDLHVGLAGSDVAQLQRGLRAAGLDVSDIDGVFGKQTAKAVDVLYSRAGYQRSSTLPVSEVVVAPTLPAQVDTVSPIGSRLDGAGSVATLGLGVVEVAIRLDGAAAARITPRMTARITVGSETKLGTVRAVLPPTPSDNTGLSTVILRPTIALPRSAVGAPAVGIITVSVVSHAALLVPARAVAIGRGGQSRLLASRAGRPAAPVDVRVLGSIGGVSAVAPKLGDALKVGDRVQVG